MIRWLQSHLKGPIWQDRRRVYAIVVNVMAQVTGFIAGLMTPSSQGAWLVWSFCIPYTYLLYCHIRGNNFKRYTMWGGIIGLLYLFVISWAEGGIRSSTASWFMVVPLALHYLMDAQKGKWAVGVALVMLVGLAQLDRMGLVFDSSVNVLDAPVLASMSLLDFLTVSMMVFAIPLSYENSIQERYETIHERQTALEAKQQELEYTLVLRDRFIASVSHELRTPMNAILGLNQVLLERVKDKPEALRVLRHTQQSADHLMTVINDVLDYSQFTTGELVAHKERFRLHEVVQAAYDMFIPRTESTTLQYQCDIASNVPNWVYSDRHRLMQVLVNLLGNALKFTPQGQVRLIVRTSATGVVFAVEDTGIGIAPENLETIFERYAQGDEHTQKQFGGTGLGLTISRKLVGLLGGKLQVSSRVGEGSRFWFELPLTEQGTADQPEHAQPTTQASHGGRLRFLVVDDQVVNRKLVKLILTQHCNDCHVAEAVNGEDALARLAKDEFDMVIMDMVMPGMDGIEATQRIRTSGDPRMQNLPVLGLTANVTQSDIARFERAGVNEIMLKPLQVERLIQSIQRMLNRTH